MGRLLLSSIRVDGELVAVTPVHSGGPGESVLSDLPLAVDGNDTVYFPGTSIAGPLRAWWRRAAEPDLPDLVDNVWGRVESESGPNKGKGWASILLVHDAPLIEETDLDLAQHVSIDRETGTAAGTLKFDRELAPARARFRLSLEIQRPAGSYGPGKKLDNARWREVQQLLRGMLEDLACGAIRFGADKSRGRGGLRLEKLRISSRNLGCGILATLRGSSQSLGAGETSGAGSGSTESGSAPDEAGAPPAGGEVLAGSAVDCIGSFFGAEVEAIRPPKTLIELTLECRPVAPVLQRHEAEGTTVDMLPAVAIDGNERKPFLSGTGIKGAFRAQSERILRTVLGLEDLTSDPLDLVVALYGDPARKTHGAGAAPGRDDPRYSRSGRGAVSFNDCRFDRGLSIEEWRKLLTFSQGGKDERLVNFHRELSCTKWKAFTPAALVAIDRWTGGAADNFLFGRLEPELAPITLTAAIDPERIAPPPGFWKPIDSSPSRPARSQPDIRAERCALASFRGAALALFLLTLRDFALGRIPLGYGVNRGLGDLDLCKATISGWSDPGPRDDGADHASGEEGSARASDIVLGKKDFDDGEKMKPFQSLQDAWTAYPDRKPSAEDTTDD